ncbi:MAG: UrcA family protein, partial [Gammaproteobacteria bacterium]|nr:UrcA family protein [Gammaproteobacteria bacterium]
MDVIKPFGVLVCVAVLGFSSLASAGEYTMTYSEGELKNIQGVKAVHARMVKAATRYCPTYTEIRSLADVRTCVNGVVSDLVGTVNHSGL